MAKITQEIVEAAKLPTYLAEVLAKNPPTSSQMAFFGTSPSLGYITKVHDKRSSKAVFYLLLEEALSLLDQKVNLNPNQMGEMINRLYSRWYFLKVDEIKYLLNRGVMGEYGANYNRVDIMIINEWFVKYDTEERIHQVEQKEHNKKAATDGGKTVPMPQSLRDLADNMKVEGISHREAAIRYKKENATKP